MANDIFPTRDSDLANWCDNYKTKIATHGPVLGLDPPTVTAHQGWCQNIIDEITNTEQARATYAQVVADKKMIVKDRKGLLRTGINQLKTHPAFTQGIGEDLDVFSEQPDFDPDTFKPTAKATVFPGYVRVDFAKDQSDGANIYARLKGTTGWTLLGRDNFPPYDDTRPLTTPNVPETREYQVIAVVGDQQVGQPSDIVSAVFGG